MRCTLVLKLKHHINSEKSMQNEPEYELIKSSRKTLAAEIKQGRLIIRAPHQAADDDIRRFIQKNRQWIETHLAKSRSREAAAESIPKLTPEELPARAAYYAPLIGVTYGRITIRNQTSRWGSCSSKGNLNFNCLLMLAPPEVLDSVVVHELCHRREMNHSQKFYAEVLRVFPTYHTQEKWLKEHGGELLKRLRD